MKNTLLRLCKKGEILLLEPTVSNESESPNQTQISKVKKERKEWSLGEIIGVIIIGYVLGATVLYFVTDNWSDRGTFGDMFGSLNTLFSALALGAVAYSTMLQRKDLEITRADFKIQVGEIQRQAEATAESAKQLEKQQLLMNYQMNQETVLALLELKEKVYIADRLDKVSLQSVAMYPEYNQRFSNIIYSILDFIQTSELSNEQKDLLYMILKVNISTREYEILEKVWEKNQHRLILLQRIK